MYLTSMSFSEEICFCEPSSWQVFSDNFTRRPSTFFCHLLPYSHRKTPSEECCRGGREGGRREEEGREGGGRRKGGREEGGGREGEREGGRDLLPHQHPTTCTRTCTCTLHVCVHSTNECMYMYMYMYIK